MAYSNKDIVSGGGAYSLVQELGKQLDNSISIQENSTKWLTLENNNLGINTTLTSEPIINTTSGSTTWASFDRDNSGSTISGTSFNNCFGKLHGNYSWDSNWATLASVVRNMTPSGLVNFTNAWGYGTYSNTNVSSNTEYRSFTLSRVYSSSSSNSYYLIGLKLKDAYLLFYAQENNSTDATYTVPPIEDFTYIKDLSGKKVYGYFNTIIESGAKPEPVPIDATITTDHISRTEPETLEVYDEGGKLKVSEDAIKTLIPETKGVPAGGTTGQILAKSSATDYDMQWVEAPNGGGATSIWPFVSLKTLSFSYTSLPNSNDITVFTFRDTSEGIAVCDVIYNQDVAIGVIQIEANDLRDNPKYLSNNVSINFPEGSSYERWPYSGVASWIDENGVTLTGGDIRNYVVASGEYVRVMLMPWKVDGSYKQFIKILGFRKSDFSA